TTLARQRQSNDEGERAAAWAELSMLVEAVVGDGQPNRIAVDDLAAAMVNTRGTRVLATPGFAARDAAAYRLLALGYSAHETSDVVSGRITRRALDTARKMLMIGRGPDVAANYLDSQYKQPFALALEPPLARHESEIAALDPMSIAIERYSGLYQV